MSACPCREVVDIPQSYAEQLVRIQDRRTATALGVTMIAAAKLYQQPLQKVRALYVQEHGCGKVDHWGVWYARPCCLKAARAQAFTDPDVATRRASVQRAHDRRARLQDKIQAARP